MIDRMLLDRTVALAGNSQRSSDQTVIKRMNARNLSYRPVFAAQK